MQTFVAQTLACSDINTQKLSSVSCLQNHPVSRSVALEIFSNSFNTSTLLVDGGVPLPLPPTPPSSMGNGTSTAVPVRCGAELSALTCGGARNIPFGEDSRSDGRRVKSQDGEGRRKQRRERVQA